MYHGPWSRREQWHTGGASGRFIARGSRLEWRGVVNSLNHLDVHRVLPNAMINNLPVKTLKHGDITIEGYSRAAVQTYWRFPELKLGFDLGAQPWSFMGTETWFVSHGHLDHIAALPVYVARRRMMKMTPPVIYMPECTIEPMQKILRLFTRLDRGRLPCELKPLVPGDEIELSRELVVTATATRHTVPALGYIVWERRRKLKAEYQHLTGPQIRDLRLAGTEVAAETRRPLVAYLGDSAPPGLDDNPAMYEAKILVCELTFVAPNHRKEKIHKYGHIHLDDLVERRGRFKNELIIAAHLSTRYSTKSVRACVAAALPDMLDGRLHVWL
jgi:ribonuclease Z